MHINLIVININVSLCSFLRLKFKHEKESYPETLSSINSF